MNEHPEDLLAGFVEGDLDADERTLVEEHLRECDRCREDVELAREARGLLASLPELDAPEHIALSVRRRSRRIPPRVWRFAGAAAAAVVLAGGMILALGQIDIGGGQQESGSAEAPSTGPERAGAEEGEALQDQDAPVATGGGWGKAASATAAPPLLPIYEESGREYESADLAPLARRLRDDANAALDLGLARTATGFFEEFDRDEFIPEVRRAINCVLADVPPRQLIVPFRIEAAGFEGSPVYVVSFLQGPTPSEQYDRIVLWVVHRETCDLISLAHQIL